MCKFTSAHLQKASKKNRKISAKKLCLKLSGLVRLQISHSLELVCLFAATLHILPQLMEKIWRENGKVESVISD
jgi:hypothetical protein